MVHGEVYRVDAETLARLDKLEGYNQPGQEVDIYDRQPREVSRPLRAAGTVHLVRLGACVSAACCCATMCPRLGGAEVTVAPPR